MFHAIFRQVYESYKAALLDGHRAKFLIEAAAPASLKYFDENGNIVGYKTDTLDRCAKALTHPGQIHAVTEVSCEDRAASNAALGYFSLHDHVLSCTSPEAASRALSRATDEFLIRRDRPHFCHERTATMGETTVARATVNAMAPRQLR